MAFLHWIRDCVRSARVFRHMGHLIALIYFVILVFPQPYLYTVDLRDQK